MRYFKIGISLVLIVIWLVIIFSLSNDTAEESSSKSDVVAEEIAEVIYKDENKKKELVYPIRKIAHGTVYFILNILVMNLLFQLNRMNYKYYLLGILFCILYAISDEVHQLYISGRSGELRDVFIDSMGSILGCLFYLGIYKLIRKIKNV
jgi:VanZ family protein